MTAFVNSKSTLDICLKFVFIEMLDKLYTYTVCCIKSCLSRENPQHNSSLLRPIEIQVYTTLSEARLYLRLKAS